MRKILNWLKTAITFSNIVTFKENIYCEKSLNVGDEISVVGFAVFENEATFADAAYFLSTADISNDLSVSGITSLNGKTNISELGTYGPNKNFDLIVPSNNISLGDINEEGSFLSYLSINNSTTGNIYFYSDVGKLTIDTISLVISNLPTTDPAVFNQIWNDAGTLKISAG